jgi:hypothetical protein
MPKLVVRRSNVDASIVFVAASGVASASALEDRLITTCSFFIPLLHKITSHLAKSASQEVCPQILSTIP